MRTATATGAETDEEERSSRPCSMPPTATTNAMASWRLREAQLLALLLVKKRTSLRPLLVREH